MSNIRGKRRSACKQGKEGTAAVAAAINQGRSSEGEGSTQRSRHDLIKGFVSYTQSGRQAGREASRLGFSPQNVPFMLLSPLPNGGIRNVQFKKHFEVIKVLETA